MLDWTLCSRSISPNQITINCFKKWGPSFSPIMEPPFLVPPKAGLKQVRILLISCHFRVVFFIISSRRNFASAYVRSWKKWINKHVLHFPWNQSMCRIFVPLKKAWWCLDFTHRFARIKRSLALFETCLSVVMHLNHDARNSVSGTQVFRYQCQQKSSTYFWLCFLVVPSYADPKGFFKLNLCLIIITCSSRFCNRFCEPTNRIQPTSLLATWLSTSSSIVLPTLSMIFKAHLRREPYAYRPPKFLKEYFCSCYCRMM